MSDSILNIIINTVKRGDGDKQSVAGVKNMANAFKQLTGFSLASTTAIGLTGMATGSLVKLLKESVSETEQYVQSVTDQARVVGMDVEEMSRLIQATDDVFISQEKLEKSMLAATRRGIDVSREGLKKLSEEYLSLDPKMERGYLLMQTFGRSGADMGKLMELGADGIDAAMDSVSKSLLVTAASSQNIENYKRSIDNLNDSWQGVKYTIGNEAIPELDYMMRLLTKGVDPVEAQHRAIKQLEFEIRRLGGSNGFAKDKVAELQAEIDLLKNTVPGTTVEIGAMAGEVGLVTQYFKELTAEMIFNKLAANMDEEAQMQLAMQMGLIDFATYSTMNALDDLTKKYDTNADGVITAKEKTAEYNLELAALIGYQEALRDRTVTYTVAMIQNGSINNQDILPLPPKPGEGPGGANGLNFIVPPGYPNDSFPIRVESGEHVQVTPAGQTQQMMGGATNVTNYFYGISVDEVMRQLQLQGVGR